MDFWICDGFLDSRWVPGFTRGFPPKGSFKFFVWKTVSQEAPPPLWTQFSIGNSDKSFHPKGSFKFFSNGKLCPKDGRHLLGQCFPSEESDKSFHPKSFFVFFSNGNCVLRGGATSWDTVRMKIVWIHHGVTYMAGLRNM